MAPLIPDAVHARELIAFEGAVDWRAAAKGAALRGSARRLEVEDANASAEFDSAEVLFSGPVLAAPLPARLHQARVFDGGVEQRARGAGAQARKPLRRVRIEAREGSFTLGARSVQVHRHGAHAFFGALPRVYVPWGVRVGWVLLLGLLRISPLARLVTKLRG